MNKWFDELDNHKLKLPLTEATIENAFEIAMKKVRQRRERELQNIRESISFNLFFFPHFYFCTK